jgi:putative membrane protein
MTNRMTERGETQVTPEDAAEDAEFEPDYRFTLANERTFLAWLRTAMALLAAALAVLHLLPASLGDATTAVSVAVLLALAFFSTVTSYRRWNQVQAAMRRGLPLPSHGSPRWLTVGFSVAVVLILGLLVVDAVLP